VDFDVRWHDEKAGVGAVVFNEPARDDTLAGLSIIASRYTSSLRDTYGINAGDLARLMNFWRSEALAASSVTPASGTGTAAVAAHRNAPPLP
jgi:hypothetical protein